MQEAQLTQAYLQEHGIEREILLPDSKDIEQYGYLADYVDSWINTLERDTKEIGRALKDCVKMVQYVKDNWYPQELKKQHSLENQATNTTTQSKESKSYVNSQTNASSTTKAMRK